VAVAFRPDGRRLAVWAACGPESGELTLWDLDGGRPTFIQRLPAHPRSFPRNLQFSPDGRRLVAVGSAWGPHAGDPNTHPPGRLTLWDVSDGGADVVMETACPTVSPWQRGDVPLLVFSPDGGSLAASTDPETIAVWEAKTGEQRCVLRGLGTSPQVLGFSDDGTRVLTAGMARPAPSGNFAIEAKLWDADTGQALLTLPLGRTTLNGDAPLHFDGRRILVPDGSFLRVIDGSPLP
jgi:WD40 repeat protein